MLTIGILGSTGMLGSTMTHVLENKPFLITEFNKEGLSVTGNNESHAFDALIDSNLDSLHQNYRFDYVINCIGMIKQIINEQDPKSRSLAIAINSYFPKKLNEYFNRSHTPILTIGTDCVYSGQSGKYSEAHKFDANDVYGTSKILGEQGCDNTLILRSSIVGRDKRNSNSLLEWVLSQPKSGVIEGYVNHLWNGLTTLHFAKIISGVIENSRFEPATLHVVPKNTVSKFDLIKIIANEFGRSDLKILKSEAANFTDRTLSTTDPKRNRILWEQAGYKEIPTIEQMIEEYRLEITTHSSYK